MNCLKGVNLAHLLLGLLVVSAAFVLLTPSSAQSAGSIFHSAIGTICDDTFPRYQGVTNRVVHCLQDSIIWGTSQYFGDVYDYLKNTVYAFFTLAVVLFGVGVATQSVENVGRDSFMLLVKLAVVIGALENMHWAYTSLVDIMEGLLNLVVQFGMSGYGFIHCPFSSPIEFGNVWFRIDCMLDTLVGIGNKGPGLDVSGPSGLSRGILYFFMTSLPGSALGLVFVLMGFYTLFTLGMAVLRAAQTYLLGFLGISFMMAVAPLFIPLLVMKQTKVYFDKWFKIIIAFILQPVILFAFLNMSLIAIDIVMVGGEDSFMRTIAGDRVIDSNMDGWLDGDFNMNTFLEDPLGDGSMNLFTDENAVLNVPGAMFDAACTTEVDGFAGERVAEYREDLCGAPTEDGTGYVLPFKMINYAALAELRSAPGEPNALNITSSASDVLSDPSEKFTPKQKDMAEQMRAIVTTNALIVLLVSFLFMSMLNYIPAMAHDLSGGAYETPNLYYARGEGALGGALPFEEQMRDGMGSMVSGMREDLAESGAAVPGGLAIAGGMGAAIYEAIDGASPPDSAQVPASHTYTYSAAREMLEGKEILVDVGGGNFQALSDSEAYRVLGAQDLRAISRADDGTIILNQDGSISERSAYITEQGASTGQRFAAAMGTRASVSVAEERLREERAEVEAAQRDLAELQEQNDAMTTLRAEGADAYTNFRLQQDALQQMQEAGAFNFGGGATPDAIQDVINNASSTEEISQGLSALGIRDTADQYAAVVLNEQRGNANDATVSSFLSEKQGSFAESAAYGAAFGAAMETVDTEEKRETLRTEYTGMMDSLAVNERMEAQLERDLGRQEADVTRAQADLARAEELQTQREQRVATRDAQTLGYDRTSAEGRIAFAEDQQADVAEAAALTARTELTTLQNQLTGLEDGVTSVELRALNVEPSAAFVQKEQAVIDAVGRVEEAQSALNAFNSYENSTVDTRRDAAVVREQTVADVFTSATEEHQAAMTRTALEIRNADTPAEVMQIINNADLTEAEKAAVLHRSITPSMDLSNAEREALEGRPEVQAMLDTIEDTPQYTTRMQARELEETTRRGELEAALREAQTAQTQAEAALAPEAASMVAGATAVLSAEIEQKTTEVNRLEAEAQRERTEANQAEATARAAYAQSQQPVDTPTTTRGGATTVTGDATVTPLPAAPTDDAPQPVLDAYETLSTERQEYVSTETRLNTEANQAQAAIVQAEREAVQAEAALKEVDDQIKALEEGSASLSAKETQLGKMVENAGENNETARLLAASEYLRGGEGVQGNIKGMNEGTPTTTYMQSVQSEFIIETKMENGAEVAKTADDYEEALRDKIFGDGLANDDPNKRYYGYSNLAKPEDRDLAAAAMLSGLTPSNEAQQQAINNIMADLDSVSADDLANIKQDIDTGVKETTDAIDALEKEISTAKAAQGAAATTGGLDALKTQRETLVANAERERGEANDLKATEVTKAADRAAILGEARDEYVKASTDYNTAVAAAAAPTAKTTDVADQTNKVNTGAELDGKTDDNTLVGGTQKDMLETPKQPTTPEVPVDTTDTHAKREFTVEETARLEAANASIAQQQEIVDAANERFAEAQAEVVAAQAALRDAREGIAENVDVNERLDELNTRILALEEGTSQEERALKEAVERGEDGAQERLETLQELQAQRAEEYREEREKLQDVRAAEAVIREARAEASDAGAQLEAAEERMESYQANLATLTEMADLQRQAQEREAEREEEAGEEEERTDQTERVLERASAQDSVALAQAARERFTQVQNTLDETYQLRHAANDEVQRLSDEATMLREADLTEPHQQRMMAVELQLDTQDPAAIEAARVARLAEIETELPALQERVEQLSEQIESDTQVRDSMEGQYRSFEEQAARAEEDYWQSQNAVNAVGDVPEIGRIESEIEALEARLERMDDRPAPRPVQLNELRQTEMEIAAIADPANMAPERLERLEDTMFEAQAALRDGASIESLMQGEGALAELSDADRAVVMYAMSTQTPGHNDRIRAAIPENAKAAFEREFAEALADVREDISADAGAADERRAEFEQAERIRLEAELEALREELDEQGVNPRPRVGEDGRELIRYEDLVGYFNNARLVDAEGQPVNMRDYYNNLSEAQLADLKLGADLGLRPELMAANTGMEMAEDGTISTAAFEETPPVVIPQDTYTPDERSEMPYEEFKRMFGGGTGPMITNAQDEPMSAAEAYDMMSAAQLREMRRLQRELEEDDARGAVRRARKSEATVSGAFGEGQTPNDALDRMQDIADARDEQSAAESAQYGVDPDEEDDE